MQLHVMFISHLEFYSDILVHNPYTKWYHFNFNHCIFTIITVFPYLTKCFFKINNELRLPIQRFIVKWVATKNRTLFKTILIMHFKSFFFFFLENLGFQSIAHSIVWCYLASRISTELETSESLKGVLISIFYN